MKLRPASTDVHGRCCHVVVRSAGAAEDGRQRGPQAPDPEGVRWSRRPDSNRRPADYESLSPSFRGRPRASIVVHRRGLGRIARFRGRPPRAQSSIPVVVALLSAARATIPSIRSRHRRLERAVVGQLRRLARRRPTLGRVDQISLRIGCIRRRIEDDASSQLGGASSNPWSMRRLRR